MTDIPDQQALSDPLDMPLPCNVQINHITFRKGVKLRTLVKAAARWHAMLLEKSVLRDNGNMFIVEEDDVR